MVSAPSVCVGHPQTSTLHPRKRRQSWLMGVHKLTLMAGVGRGGNQFGCTCPPSCEGEEVEAGGHMGPLWQEVLLVIVVAESSTLEEGVIAALPPSHITQKWRFISMLVWVSSMSILSCAAPHSCSLHATNSSSFPGSTLQTPCFSAYPLVCTSRYCLRSVTQGCGMDHL